MLVSAEPGRVWDLVTDITRMGEWSSECTGGRWTHGATGPAPGARFVGFNAHGWVRWRTHCRVIECARPTRFAFTVTENKMIWGWRLEPEGARTRLTQWREHTSEPNVFIRAFAASGLIGRNREQLMVDGMHRTLAAVKASAEHAGR